ncbi:hypothetical protein CXP39_01160 [Mesoplasma syrphidae]|uniref:Uncharacterized protein n=1 Tax=Mesoplasma syrphidae TaxID=225999 RepID=A0A2K9CCN8_9MOLU|nr:hypothetical protein [Mesoplasma syrphidae]AUF83414.1 hypothetical protein CXP39_01160 [Mesoplasma syrphidae]
MSKYQEIEDPVNSYRSQYQEQANNNIENYFENLVKTSRIDIQANRETVGKINKLLLKISQLDSLISKLRKQKSLLTILNILLLITGIVGFIFGIVNWQTWSLGVISGVVIGSCVGFSLIFVFWRIIKRRINPKIQNHSIERQKLDTEKQQFEDEAWIQMANLNSLFEFDDTTKIFSKTLPSIVFDSYLTENRLQQFLNRGLEDYSKYSDTSVIFAQSGTIGQNPFLILKTLEKKIINKTYTGSLVITYTERVRDSQGKMVSQMRTQTLFASVVKPCPNYYVDSELIFANDAAPNLKFSRVPSKKVDSENNKSYQKFIEKRAKKIDKAAASASLKGSNFNVMANKEFEVMFNALDRNHEIEFRLLFSALAQQQLLNLIKNQDDGYGDHFSWNKHDNLNYLFSPLMEKDLATYPERYISYDYNYTKKTFIDFNTQFFKDVYFALAPLLAVPLYQQLGVDDKYDFKFGDQMSSWELEVLAYGHENELKKVIASDVNAIIKTQVVETTENGQEIEAHVSGYETYQRVEYVPMFGRDGFLHNVPVPWVEYISVSNAQNIVIKTIPNLKRADYIKALKINDSNDEQSANQFGINPQQVRLYNKRVSVIKNDNSSENIYEYLNKTLCLEK